MQLHDLRPPKGSHKRRKIVGRGPGSGHGKTSCKGHKGQNARSGRGILRTLDSGAVPLIRRLAKVGFRRRNPLVYHLLDVQDLNRFKSGANVTAETLKEKGLIQGVFRPYKILGDGEIKQAITIEAYSFSKSAEEKIKNAGGKIQVIDQGVIKKRLATEKKSRGNA